MPSVGLAKDGEMSGENPIERSIAPWLAVDDGARAVAFYQKAFDAVEVYRLDGVDGQMVVARLQVGGAEFWLQEDNEGSPAVRGAGSVRMVMTVDDPDACFAKAISAGGTEVAPVSEAHGWRTGRITDPFGHDWEFSKPLPA
jgi:PhnB protein